MIRRIAIGALIILACAGFMLLSPPAAGPPPPPPTVPTVGVYIFSSGYGEQY